MRNGLRFGPKSRQNKIYYQYYDKDIDNSVKSICGKDMMVKKEPYLYKKVDERGGCTVDIQDEPREGLLGVSG